MKIEQFAGKYRLKIRRAISQMTPASYRESTGIHISMSIATPNSL